MQTFLPYPNFARSAYVLDNKRLGKQRVECLQILKTLAKGPTEVIQRIDGRTNEIVTIHRKTPWYNHPAVKMWKGYEYLLYHTYMAEICAQWLYRGFQDTCYTKARLIVLNTKWSWQSLEWPSWLGDEAFHASHRSNLLRKDFLYYSQFGWKEPTDLPYVWPSKLTA